MKGEVIEQRPNVGEPQQQHRLLATMALDHHRPMIVHHPGHHVRKRSLGLGQTAGGKSDSSHEHRLD